MSARSTGRSAVTVTAPLARSTATDSTPATAAISSVTARWQCSQVMPVTVKVVEPMKVRGVPDSMGTPRAVGGGAVGMKRRRGGGGVSPGKSPGFAGTGCRASDARGGSFSGPRWAAVDGAEGYLASVTVTPVGAVAVSARKGCGLAGRDGEQRQQEQCGEDAGGG